MPVPIHIPTLYSADSEGSVLREFMEAQEQNRTSQAFRSDVPGNGNAAIHHGSTVQRPENGQTQDSHGLSSAPVILFSTSLVNPATSDGFIQEPGIGTQDEQDHTRRFSQDPQPTRKTVQDPGPSDRGSQESQHYRPRHEFGTALESGLPATDAQEPHRSPNFGVSEDQILPDSAYVQDQLRPESRLHNPYESPSPVSIQEDAHARSVRAFQKSRAGNETIMDPGPSKQRSHRRSRSHNNEAMISDTATTEQAMRQLKEQKKETKTLRKALGLTVERMDAENQRVLALERNNLKVIERFSMLNESRLAAQKEALNAGSELQAYQFQLANAHKEITRTQEMLRTLEKQRDDAEQAASRARATARQYAQEQMIAAAQAEGRRLGFEAGLRRAREEAALRTGFRRVPSSQVRRESDTQVTVLPPDFDIERVISSPVHRRTLRVHRQSIPREPSPPPEIRVQSPISSESEAFEEESLPPHPPGPAPPAPEIDQPPSPGPSVLRYAVSIPPASEIEQQNSPNPNQYPSESSQPWVTAREYHQITGTQPSPEHIIQTNLPGESRNVAAFASNPLQDNPGKKKKSWFHRTLTRPWRKASRVVPKASSSWYQPASSADPPPIVRTHDFGAGPQTSADRASVSMSLSHFEIVSPSPGAPGPSYRNPHGNEHSFTRSDSRRRFIERAPLHSIDEDSSSDVNEAVHTLRRDITPISPSMGQIRELLGDTTSNYSDPKAVEDWRRSSASVSITTETNPSRPAPNAVSGRTGPPRRRPVHLTVPALLAPQHATPPSSSVIPGSSQNPAFLGVRDVRPSLQRNPTSGTVYGITVEPPSCSPTEAPNSARPLQENLLSPNLIHASSLRSIPLSLLPSGARDSMTPPIFNPAHPGSAASHPQSPHIPPKFPTTQASSRSLAQTDQPPPSQYQKPVNHHNRTSHVTTDASRRVTDNASIQSGPNSVNAARNAAQQGYPHPAPVKPNHTSHRRTVSDSTYIQPNASLPVGNDTVNGIHDLRRIASNQSISSVRSANSRYSRFDPSSYVEPTELYRPVSVGPNGQGGRRRTMSNATGTTLSYIS